MNFCSECGCNFSKVDEVTDTIASKIRNDKLVNNMRNQIQNLGQKAHQGISKASSGLLDQASNVTQMSRNDAVQRRVSESMSSLVNKMINMSSVVENSVSSDLLSNVDLFTGANFVAFEIGVYLSMTELGKINKAKIAKIDSTGDDS
jgi:hypothetical protein